MSTRHLYTISEAARTLSKGRNTVYQLIEEGRLTRVEDNGKPYVTGKSIDAYVAGLEAGAERQAEFVNKHLRKLRVV
jgi:excisionase family DNA binding protein